MKIEKIDTNDFPAAEYLFTYKKPSIINGIILDAHAVTCPICDDDNDCVIGDESPVECECGNKIYVTEDVIFCDESEAEQPYIY